MPESATVTVAFEGGPAAVALPPGAELRHCLDLANSPILFGCRTGLCGTCLVEVSGPADPDAPDRDEKEILELYAPGNPRARLACQLRACAHLRLRYLGNSDAA